MRIGARLEAALALLPDGIVLADIGCDHGKLAVAAIESGRAVRAIASDISAPSLEKARQLARERVVSERLALRLGDGLDVLAPGEADVAVIAGMGGELIAELLTRQAVVARSCRALLLQPMQNVGVLRRFLRENGWRIEDETLCAEGPRLFAWLRVSPGVERLPADIAPAWSDELGPRNWEKREPLLIELLARETALLAQQIEAISQGGTPNAASVAAAKQTRLREAKTLIGRLREEDDGRMPCI